MKLVDVILLFVFAVGLVLFIAMVCYDPVYNEGYKDGINETKYYYNKDIQECFIHVGKDKYRVSCNDPFPFDKAKIIGTNVEAIGYE